VGTLTSVFIRDLHAFAKELDPTVMPCWLGQTRNAKRRLWSRIHGSWEFTGPCTELNDSWFRKKMSVCVSQSKFQLNEKIRQGLPRLLDVPQVYWDKLVALQNEPEVIEKSSHMASISNGRPAKDMTTVKLQKTAVYNLV